MIGVLLILPSCVFGGFSYRCSGGIVAQGLRGVFAGGAKFPPPLLRELAQREFTREIKPLVRDSKNPSLAIVNRQRRGLAPAAHLLCREARARTYLPAYACSASVAYVVSA